MWYTTVIKVYFKGTLRCFRKYLFHKSGNAGFISLTRWFFFFEVLTKRDIRF